MDAENLNNHVSSLRQNSNCLFQLPSKSQAPAGVNNNISDKRSVQKSQDDSFFYFQVALTGNLHTCASSLCCMKKKTNRYVESMASKIWPKLCFILSKLSLTAGCPDTSYSSRRQLFTVWLSNVCGKQSPPFWPFWRILTRGCGVFSGADRKGSELSTDEGRKEACRRGDGGWLCGDATLWEQKIVKPALRKSSNSSWLRVSLVLQQ